MRSCFSLVIIVLFLLPSCSTFRLFSSDNTAEVKDQLADYLKTHEITPEDPAIHDSIWQAGSPLCPSVSKPLWIVPSSYLPEDIHIQLSNNNVTMAVFGNRLYLAFRTSPTHFASKKTGVYILSTKDGSEWRKEMELFPGRDVREPYLIAINGKLHFYCFEAGTKMTTFEPKFINCYNTSGNGVWAGPENVLGKGEVHWSFKNRNGKTYLSSYEGSHYQLKGESCVSLLFKQTTDGKNFSAAGDSERVYLGGVSEADFEFDRQGNLWAVTRLEDGDKTGFGSHVVFASKDKLSHWEFPKTANPNCYMSPRMFRQGDDLYLVARKQLGKKPFGRANRNKSMRHQRLKNWIGFSLSPKTTALYKINKTKREVEWVTDLPGAGDTAFPSIIRLDENRLLIANYSSPVKFKNRSWLSGQLGRTGIYLIVITFSNCN